MSYELPFKPDMRLIEFGGGTAPVIRPNADIRPGPAVDLVVDFNRPLPILDESYDGIFAKFMIEHISWRALAGFLGETHRILAPGGVAVFITANFLEQCKQAIAWFEAGRSIQDVSQNCFGDQNYDGDGWVHNAHFLGMSPESAIRLFQAQGFVDVRTMPLPECATDMIIEAYKSAAVITRGAL